MSKKNPKHVPLPSKSEILEFIQDSPGRVGKREVSRAFNLSVEHRPHLRQIMKELEEEGLIQRGHKRRFARPGALPEVTVVEITSTDQEGELIGKPLSWHEEEPPPRIFLMPVRKGLPAVGIGDRVLARLSPAREGAYDARVIKRITGAPAKVLGILEVGSNGTMLRPTDRRDKQDYLVPKGQTGKAEPGDLVEAEILPGRQYGLRSVRVTDVLGSMDSPKAISLIAIHTHGIPYEFPIEAIEQAESAGPATEGKRADLRHLPLVTIDGEDARDFDDAVWAEKDGDGWHVVVAIADVAHYVQTGDALDRSAYERGNSVYFPDRVVPMLPEALSNGWCSLRPKEDRPCMAVHMWFDAQGNKQRHEFVRGLMRSVARLTYTQVQNAADGRPDDLTGLLLESVIEPLYGAFNALAEARKRRGALEIDIPERRVLIDENGKLIGVVPRARYDSHKLIEEMMIAANVCAAETLEGHKQPCMYRVHDEPAFERVTALREFLQSMDLNIAHGALRPQQFNHILERVKGTPQEYLVNTVVLRSQAQAIYSPENRGHFGLGLKKYAHFTSPIRRYSDLLVHRALISGLKAGTDGLPPGQGSEFESIGEHISMTERRAATAEREAVDRFTAQYLSSQIGADFVGRVTGVTRFGLFVELQETGASGLVPISTLPNDYYVHDEVQHALIGRATRKTFRLGDGVTIRLREADAATGGMIFELLAVERAEGKGDEPGGRLPSAARKKSGFKGAQATAPSERAGRKRILRGKGSKTSPGRRGG